MKKVLLGLGAVAIAVAVVPMFAAFEAHVINVTAKIENALAVNTEPIHFGTVFPQEQLDRTVRIVLSESFMDEPRVDDVQYFLRQKPKCGITSADGTVLDETSTTSGHPTQGPDDVPFIDCGEPPRQLQPGEIWGSLPLLCPYLSKHPISSETDPSENDGALDAFHEIGHWVGHQWVWNDVKGYLAKSARDVVDVWNLDLKVPCFGGHCAQDWEEFVHDINPDADPDLYVQPITDEHKIFGCDLWIEVNGVSMSTDRIGCLGKADVMLTLDRSGSISSDELATLKNAAKAFVGALDMSADGVHAGMVSFSSTSTLDVHLTDASSTVATAIDLLISGGTTNLEAALQQATGELANPGDGHDRADGESPDFIVLITDGAPTTSNTGGDHAANAAAAAAAAKAAGITIYVVGVGTTADTTAYLKTIASSDAHYFDAADFDALQAILKALTTCS